MSHFRQILFDIRKEYVVWLKIYPAAIGHYHQILLKSVNI